MRGAKTTEHGRPAAYDEKPHDALPSVHPPTNAIPPVVFIVTGNQRIKSIYYETQLHRLLGETGAPLSDARFRELFDDAQRNLEQGGMLDCEQAALPWDVHRNDRGQFVVALDVTGREKDLLTASVQTLVKVDSRGAGNTMHLETVLGFRSPLGFGEKISFSHDQSNQTASSLSLFLPLAFQYLPLYLRFPWLSASHGRVHVTDSWESRAAVQSLLIKRTTLAFDVLSTSRLSPSLTAGWEVADEVPCFYAAGTGGEKAAAMSGSMWGGAHAAASPAVLGACSARSKWFLRGSQMLWDTRRRVESGRDLGTSVHLTVELASRHVKPELELLSSYSVAGIYNDLAAWYAALLGDSRWGKALRASPWAYAGRGSYWHDVVVDVAGSAALIRPVPCGRACSRPPLFGDRLYLGGSSSIRGFDHCGIGLRSFAPPLDVKGTETAALSAGGVSSSSSSSSSGGGDGGVSIKLGSAANNLVWGPSAGTGSAGDALGGIAKLAVAPTISFPLNLGNKKTVAADSWVASLSGLRGFVGLGLGWLESPFTWGHTHRRSYASYLDNIRSEYRASATVGLQVPVPQFNSFVGLSCSVPLRASREDASKAWQISFGWQKL